MLCQFVKTTIMILALNKKYLKQKSDCRIYERLYWMLGQSILQQHTVKLTFIEINLSYNACLFIYGRKDCGLIGLGVRTDNGSYTELSICPSLHPFIHGSWDRLLPTRNSYTGKMNICLLLDLLFFLHICIKLILILDKDTLSKNKMEFF